MLFLPYLQPVFSCHIQFHILPTLFIYDCFIHLNMLVVDCGDLHNMWSHFKYVAMSFLRYNASATFPYKMDIFGSWSLSIGTYLNVTWSRFLPDG